jgi:hypothetical protein
MQEKGHIVRDRGQSPFCGTADRSAEKRTKNEHRQYDA